MNRTQQSLTTAISTKTLSKNASQLHTKLQNDSLKMKSLKCFLQGNKRNNEPTQEQLDQHINDYISNAQTRAEKSVNDVASRSAAPSSGMPSDRGRQMQ